MDLGEAGVGEESALSVGAPAGRDIAGFGIGREKEGIAIAARSQDHRIGHIALQFTADQVASDDAAGLAVNHDQLEHFPARQKRDLAHFNLSHQGAIRSEQ